MSIQKPWYLEAIQPLKKYADFKGRASRREYFYFYLLSMLILFFVSFALGILEALVYRPHQTYSDQGSVLVSLFYLLHIVIFTIPSWAVSVRRLHDIGRSGWTFFWCLFPLVGPIILLVFFVSDSQPGTNQYGPNPKESA